MILFDEIVSIEELDSDSLRYDISVADNHNFFANGILVHNCENFITEVFTDNSESKFEVSLKLDGSSMSCYFKDGEVGVCSRNLDMKLNDANAGNTFIATANATGILDALSKLGRNLMVSGELMGPNIQENREKLKAHMFYVFDIFDIDSYTYLSVDARNDVFELLVANGFTGKHAPVLATNVKLSELGITDVASSKVYVDKPSLVHPIAEGCVFKRMDGQFSFKSINHKFLLKERD